jgi:phage protein D
MSAVLERPLLYSARPSVWIAGQEQTALGDAAVSVAVSERADGLFTLEATFGNWGTHNGSIGYLYFDRSLLEFGKEIAIDLGAGQALDRVFTGRITALEGRFLEQRAPEILVLAEDRLQDLRMTRHTRVFENKSIEDIIGTVAEGQRLDKEIDIESITLPVMTQLNQSDLAFLRQVAEIADADVWIEQGKLHVQARARRRGTEVTLTYGQTLHEMSVSADLANQRTSVQVAGWDATAKDAIAEQAGAEKIQGELDGGMDGATLLSQTFGDRPEQLVHQIPLTTRDARARADARFKRLSRRFITGRGVCEGDGRIRVGSRLTLNGLGPLFSGKYFVSEAQHLFDYRTGYRTVFAVERSGLGQPS